MRVRYQDYVFTFPRRYSVFSLGNSTYEHYQAMGRYVDKSLKKLGAERVFKRGEGDDDKKCVGVVIFLGIWRELSSLRRGI